MELLFAPEAIVSSTSLLLMVGIGLIEALGLGMAGIDADRGTDLHDGGTLDGLVAGAMTVEAKPD